MAEAEQAVAVVGVAGLFPGAPDAHGFWRNIQRGVDAITEASPERLDPRFFDPEHRAVDRVYVRRGGFVGDAVSFDAGAFGIMPVAARATEPDQLLALQVSAACLADAGYDTRPFDRSRAAVILGRGAYQTPGLVRLDRNVRQGEQLALLLEELAPGLAPEVVQRIKARWLEQAGDFGPDTAIGLVPNLAASRIANRLDLNGPAYTVDAACASALIAVEHACRELRSGRCDLVLAGGTQLGLGMTFWGVFAQLGALSPTGAIRPFDRRADGLLIGEGVGLVGLKRLDRAERDGDRIYAVIHGVGSASDGRASSVMVPRVDGQLLALQRAWAEAGIDPAALGLLEAHGTGTPAGDRAETTTIGRFFGGPDAAPAVLGSVKSMIGHTMAAAGIAGLIKAVLAVHHGVLPPSLHCDEPREDLAATRFEVLAEARPWEGDGPRVAAVNAFGFGGIDAHVVLTSHGRAVPRRARPPKPADRADAPVVLLAGKDPAGVRALLDAGVARGGRGPCRLALIDPTPARVERARQILKRGEPWPGRGGIWFRDGGLVDGGGRIAFLFPGLEARFDPEVASIARHLGLPAPEGIEGGDLEQTGYGIFTLGRFLDEVLGRLGVVPDAYAGHSIGEWTGMAASGMVPAEALDAFVASLQPGTLEVPGVLFAAAACGIATAAEAIADLDGIVVSHDNCPDQVILCGLEDSVQTARSRLVGGGLVCQILPFRSGFHSPLFAEYLAPHEDAFAQLPLAPPARPLWSATTCAPYPDDPDAIRALAAEHLVTPLRFRELIERLYEEGFRVFVQVGTGSLTGLVGSTLAGRPHLAVSASEGRRSGLAQLRNLLLALYVEGADVDLASVLPPPGGPIVSLKLGSPLVRLGDDLRGAITTGPPAPVLPPTDDPVLRELGRTMEALTRAGQDVVAALQRRGERLAGSWSATRTLSVEAEPALRDHALFPQPEGWPEIADGYPVAPFSMSLELLLEAARALRPGLVAVEVAEIEALKWLAVVPPQEVTLRAEALDGGWIRAEIEGFARARVRMAPAFPEAPSPALPEPSPARPSPVPVSRLYTDGWMFHGPAYQGVEELGPVGDAGIDGVLCTPEAPGALLDNAGQVFGFWVMATQQVDRLAMPVGADRVRLYGPHPPAGARVGCRVRIARLDARVVAADLELVHDGRLWCRIDGWTDRRFETSPVVWRLMRQPGEALLSDTRGAWVRYDPSAHRTPSRDWLTRRYLDQAERAAMAAAGPRAQRAFLDERIAAKDALRQLLRRAEGRSTYPVELPLEPAGEGLRLAGDRDLRVAVDRCDEVTVAYAADGISPGIAILRGDPEDPGARAAVARRAVARAPGIRAGSGPSRLVVEHVSPDRLVVDGTPVALAADGPHLVAWTLP